MALGLVAAAGAACDDDGDEADPTATTAPAATEAGPEAPTPTVADEGHEDDEDDHEGGGVSFEAASATITVDGDTSDWDGIEPVTVALEQIDLEELDPAQAEDLDFDPLPSIDAQVRVATDDENVYVLFEIPDDYDFDPEDHNLSSSIAVMFRVDDPASPHMGAEHSDLETSLGIVDIWHWELDCGPGELAGGGGIAGGDDPACNLDDEYASTPEDREDDDTAEAENGLAGVWEHTGRAQGAGADGTWIFEMSRPLQTGDSQDGQFESGGTAHMALAYFDPDESATGWTDAGHLMSAEAGWIEVTLP